MWSNSALEHLIYSICPIDRARNSIAKDISSAVTKFEHAFRLATYTEVLLTTHGQPSSVIPRESFKCLVDMECNVNCENVRKLILRALATIRNKPLSNGQSLGCVTMRDTFGHLVQYFYYRLLSRTLKSYGAPQMHPSYADAFAVSHFHLQLKEDDYLETHYRVQFENMKL